MKILTSFKNLPGSIRRAIIAGTYIPIIITYTSKHNLDDQVEDICVAIGAYWILVFLFSWVYAGFASQKQEESSVIQKDVYELSMAMIQLKELVDERAEEVELLNEVVRRHEDEIKDIDNSLEKRARNAMFEALAKYKQDKAKNNSNLNKNK